MDQKKQKHKGLGLLILTLVLIAAALGYFLLAKPGVKSQIGDLTCTVSISCTTVLDNWDKLSEAKRSIVPSNGIILGTVTVELQEGDTVFSVLQRVVSDYNIQMEYSVSPLYQTTYIEGLGNLYEKDCGARSGWMFAVNGVFPNYGASDCTVQDGDSIRWLYTCDLGSDLS